MPNEKSAIRLSANILNYFAAFTETRFNFRTLINYRWTDNELTFDLGIFQDFQNKLLQRIKTGDKAPLTVKNNEHALSLSGDKVLLEINKALSDKFGLEYLKSCVEQEIEQALRPQEDNAGAVLWLRTFNIRTSTLSFARAIANYTTSLREHYRSFPEIIDYSNEFFYKPALLDLSINRIRTKPIGEVLQFIPVETRGNSGSNANYDEIDAIIHDLGSRIKNGFKESIGIITSFREQQARMEQTINEKLNMPELKKNHDLAIWFVGDVQG